MLWLVSCVAKPNIDELREHNHQAHIDYTDGKIKENVLILAGPHMSDDGKTVLGSLFLINVNSKADAQAFSKAEPFTQAGMFASVTFSRMRMRRGKWNPAAMEPELNS